MGVRRSLGGSVAVVGAALVLVPSAAPAAGAATCPTTVNDRAFAGAAQLRATMAKVTSFGQLRNAGSRSHNQELRWLDGRLKRIQGLRVRSNPYWVRSWQPTTHARKGPGMDLARAGELRLPKLGGSTTRIPVAGAVPYARPTNNRGSGGPLVYLPPGQQITAQNAAGKVVIRDFPQASIPAAGIQFLSLFITPDLATQTGAYARPYLAPLDQEMWNAGTAGAAGIVFDFDVPEKQVRGYWDPHNGTHYKVPGLFVGADQGAQLKALAAAGRSARVVVRARSKRAKTRNLIAPCPGRAHSESCSRPTRTEPPGYRRTGWRACWPWLATSPGFRSSAAPARSSSSSEAVTSDSPAMAPSCTRAGSTSSTTRARWHSRSPSSTWGLARSCPFRMRMDRGSISPSPGGVRRISSAPGTATPSARRPSMPRRRAISTIRPCFAASGFPWPARRRRSARWAGSGPPSNPI